MIDYYRLGSLPAKHHIAHRRPKWDADPDGCPVYYEHCLTRKGFDDGYSILYRRHNPGREKEARPARIKDTFTPAPQGPLVRRHYRTGEAESFGGLYAAQRVLVGNDDIRIASARPTDPDSGLFQDGDGDLLLFLQEGSGILDSETGRLSIRKHDYVWIPRGLVHRIRFDDGAVHVMVMECRNGLQVPPNFRNPVGQFRMDAPYCHRDFRRPETLSEPDGDPDGETTVLHKRHDVYTERVLPHHPFDVVGFDGTVYPVAFNIHDYQPKTGRVHLPPPIHTTFLCRRGSFVVCSFVPRLVDDHEDAIPCPYPHSSVDCDEILWYVEGGFTSRKGVGPGSISLHPAGIPHAPQPGRYEASIGSRRTDELAVMVDTFRPLQATVHAQACEDEGYHASWMKS